MKSTAITAMIVSGLYCVLMATGAERQNIFSADHIWVWWGPAVCWFANAIGMCFATVEFP